MWTTHDVDGFYLFGERATAGYDRMVTFDGVQNGGAFFCRSENNSEGSAFGVSTNARATKHIRLFGCEGIGMTRSFMTIRDTGDNGFEDIAMAHCYGRHDTANGDGREGIETVSGGGVNRNVRIIGGTYEDFLDGGILVDATDVRVDGAHFKNVGNAVFVGNDDFFGGSGGTDFNVESATWEGQSTVVTGFGSATRPRWKGVIGGGPFGGVDLSTVSGQFDGDLAVADGTSTASAEAWARWDAGSSAWNYVDPTGTV
jgi:hypothetical protein